MKDGKAASTKKKSGAKSNASTNPAGSAETAALDSSSDGRLSSPEHEQRQLSPLARPAGEDLRRRDPSRATPTTALELILDFLKHVITKTGKTVRLAFLVLSFAGAICAVIWMASLADLNVILTTAGAALGITGLAVRGRRKKS